MCELMLKYLVDDNMSRCTASEVARLIPLVSAQRREQALRFKHVFGQYCCLRSWEMLKDLLSSLNYPLADMSYTPSGKPFIADGPHFSISHCKEGIAVAVCDEPIGIDIESIRQADPSLIERTMNEQEQAQIHGDARLFTRFWTQKEAVAKWQGTGIESFEQLQHLLDQVPATLQTIENEKYIYTIAYGKLHCVRAEI